MRRILKAPLLSVSLFALWLVLNQSLTAGHLALAFMIAVAVPWISAPLRPLAVRIRRPRVLLRLILAVGLDVMASNLQVARGIVRRRPLRPAFVKVPLDLREVHGLAALATITTVIPGTVWSELAPDGSALLLHVFNVDDEAAFIAHFRDRYERPLMEIFE